MSTQTINTSGVGPILGNPLVNVTYDSPQFPVLPTPLNAMDQVPAFMFIGGHVVYEKNQFGNIIARNTG